MLGDQRVVDPALADGLLEPAVVQCRIRSGSCPNPVNPRSRGVLPVAILGTADFDVLDVDIASLLLEGAAPVR
jgi:hypothetical protein